MSALLYDLADRFRSSAKRDRPGHGRECSRAALAIAAAIFFSVGVEAQTSFDVASIKASQGVHTREEGTLRLPQVAVSPIGLTLSSVSLSYCIQWAYKVRSYQVSGPDWVNREQYDILAKSDQRGSGDQFRIMLQALLADRFHLRVHRETRTMPVYELVARSPAPKLVESNSDDSPRLRIVDGSLIFEHVTMLDFAVLLSELRRDAIDRPVVDKTGIEGIYDITLKSAARLLLEDPASIFGAVESAGFKLDARKGPAEILVIDHVERPSPN
jgi:uncharacterized protein (TIGR03435 family)